MATSTEVVASSTVPTSSASSTITEHASGGGSISTTTTPTVATTTGTTATSTNYYNFTYSTVWTITEGILETSTSTTATSTQATSTSVSATTTPTTVLASSTPETVVATSSLPTITEQLTDTGKVVVVSSTPEQELISPMINVPVRTEIPEIFRVGQESQIKITWSNNDNQQMEFVTYDDDGDGFIDHVSWVVPHLSTQTFEIILISNALRLDANKNTLEDIFAGVGTLDQNYISILDGQYVRVTFERMLSNTNDITLYARPTDANVPATIEVYTKDGVLVGTFATIDHDGRYRIVLSGLASSTDVFDLKVIGNVDIDYVTDPPANAYWVGGSGNWSDAANHWATVSGGAPGAGNLPDATTNVFFDATSGGAAVTATIDSSISIGSLTINGFTGTIVQSANLTITNSGGQSGNYLQSSAATFTATDPGTNTFSVTGSFLLNAGTFRRYTGIGNSSDPFIVFDVYGLQGMKTGLSSSYKLNNDINASVTSGWNSGAGFAPVGDSTTNFTGIFDGNNYTISNLFISTTTLSYVGLFGYSTNIIQDVTLTGVSIAATSTSGTAGSTGANGSDGSATSNGTAGGAGTAGSTLYLGGIVGYNTGTITNVGVNGTIIGTGGAGGAGGNGGNGGNITSGSNAGGAGGNAVSNAAATGGIAYVGGVVGYSQQGSITTATSSATVTGVGGAGGASGNAGNGGNGSVAGVGTGAGGAGGAAALPGAGNIAYVGGLIGWIQTGTVSSSFATGNVTARGGAGGNAGTSGTGGNAGVGGGGSALGGIGGAGAAGGAGGVAYAGGIAGNNSGTIRNGSYATSDVLASGGIPGNGSAGSASGASAAGSVIAAASSATATGGAGGAGAIAYAGGLVGQNNTPGFITGIVSPVYATGAVTAIGSTGKNGTAGGAGGSAGLTTSGTGGVGGAAGNGGAGGAAYAGGLIGISMGSLLTTNSSVGLVTVLGRAGRCRWQHIWATIC
jgi:hypothetical protein